MNQTDKELIKLLLKKYNEILLHSMSIAISEDLINLIIVNSEDKDFKLIEIMKDRLKFREFVTTEFIKLNNRSILKDLKNMDENFSSKVLRRKVNKGNQGRLDF